jgi:hypothetical protein
VTVRTVTGRKFLEYSSWFCQEFGVCPKETDSIGKLCDNAEQTNSWNGVVFESQLKYPIFCRALLFNIALTRVHHCPCPATDKSGLCNYILHCGIYTDICQICCSQVSWDVTQCDLVDGYQRFAETTFIFWVEENCKRYRCSALTFSYLHPVLPSSLLQDVP